jgi:exopolyphosphatase/guanosine-5'-triphosphate,3'-diphosphate pyrophosphatase
MRLACIGIGSNAIRLLIAEWAQEGLCVVRRERRGTRLFAGLVDGALTQQSIRSSVEAVAELAMLARMSGAQEIFVFATSAARDASNGDEFTRLAEQASGTHIEIITGEQEAVLSYMGASSGGRCGVIDIGGGSTEVIVGEGTSLRCALSCQMGAVRLAGQYPIRDHGDLSYVEEAARSILLSGLESHPTLSMPEKWYGTGGTFTTLAAIVRQVHWTERTYMHGTVLTLRQVEQTARMLADMPLSARRELPGLQPNRADIIVHGMCILLACMRTLGIEKITVSEYGNLEGYVRSVYGG